MNEHLIVEINETYNFKKVSCPEGHHITNWDREDILTFTASTIMYCPLTYNLDTFYCITEEEYETLSAQHLAAMDEYIKNENKGLDN